MSSSRLLAVVHLVLFVVTVSSVHLVVTTSTASIDVMASPAPHVITGYAYCSLPHHIYSLHQRLHLGFLSVYSRSVNFGSPQAVKTKPFAGDPHRTPLTHPLQGTLHSIKLAVRASSGIDETRSSSDILDSYSDEIGIRVTSPPLVLYTVAISPFDCGHSETHSGKCFRPQAGITWAWAYTSRMGLRFNHNALCEVGLGLSFISFTAKATVFNCYQNPLVGFFKVDFDVCAFLQTRALGLQVKLLFGFLLSLAISFIRLVSVIFIYQITVEYSSNCNQFGPSDS
ncbi:hypothetical protein HID58_043228 [Brassica napus]|uniref:Uncharacterized protein n=1 Tax=Brassica napus TaxID=3708 RepID=A0ABQ8BFW7_BRANA|nr:hypothetical protein HID58_043228 [Brassica napus]